MSKKIVILQPMFFPWIGHFEQIQLADTYVHFDDVQLPQGRSLVSRVKTKTPNGAIWMSIPITRRGKMLIKNIVVDDSTNWRDKHIMMLSRNYAKSPYVDDMLTIVRSVYKLDTNLLSNLNSFAIEEIADYFGIECKFLRSSELSVGKQGSKKLLALLASLGGSVYITGHGALNYLDHELFERKNIRVEYMNYNCTQYPQRYGEFDPHISILDLIANCGQDGKKLISSDTKYWKEFMDERK